MMNATAVSVKMTITTTTKRMIASALTRSCTVVLGRRWAAAAWQPDGLDFGTTTWRSVTSSSTSGLEWRQRQLLKLEQKFETKSTAEPAQTIESADDLQQMWREMEGRVTRRRMRTAEEMGGKTGRTNIKSTDEEYWLQEGLYEEQEDNDDKEKV